MRIAVLAAGLALIALAIVGGLAGRGSDSTTVAQSQPTNEAKAADAASSSPYQVYDQVPRAFGRDLLTPFRVESDPAVRAVGERLARRSLPPSSPSAVVKASLSEAGMSDDPEQLALIEPEQPVGDTDAAPAPPEEAAAVPEPVEDSTPPTAPSAAPSAAAPAEAATPAATSNATTAADGTPVENGASETQSAASPPAEPVAEKPVRAETSTPAAETAATNAVAATSAAANAMAAVRAPIAASEPRAAEQEAGQEADRETEHARLTPPAVQTPQPAPADTVNAPPSASPTPAATPAPSVVETETETESPPVAASPDVAEAQTLLARLGYNAGPADGFTGPRTAAAVRAFQRANGMWVDGLIDDPLLIALEDEADERAQRLRRAWRSSSDAAAGSTAVPVAPDRRSVAPSGGAPVTTRSTMSGSTDTGGEEGTVSSIVSGLQRMIGREFDSVQAPAELRQFCQVAADNWVYDEGTGRFLFCADVNAGIVGDSREVLR